MELSVVCGLTAQRGGAEIKKGRIVVFHLIVTTNYKSGSFCRRRNPGFEIIICLRPQSQWVLPGVGHLYEGRVSGRYCLRSAKGGVNRVCNRLCK